MLRDDIEDRFDEDSNGFLAPDYDQYCYSNIPATMLSLVGGDTSGPTLPDDVFTGIDTDRDIVVFLLIDGFGYQHWKQYGQDHDFFASVTEHGTVTPLTTVFPSTTSATITTINTGLTPQQHGLPEWTVYCEEYGQTILSLPFTTVDGEPLAPFHDVDGLFDGGTVYHDLPDDVDAVAFQGEDIAGSPYSGKALDGADVRPYYALADLGVQLRDEIEQGGTKYIYAYASHLDAVNHRYGPNTDAHQAIMAEIGSVLQRELVDELDEADASDVLLCISADHGHVNVDPEATVDLLSIDGLEGRLAEDEHGDPILPTGSPRDVFLHVKDGEIDATIELLQDELDAVVMRTEDALEQGLFGRGEASETFKRRIGDVLIMPRDGDTVWFEDGEFAYLGHHGGRTREEMLVPFAAVGLDELQ
ncbi:MAG: alkaline phosphatase family protein [Candidatus Nanohaloarchaea archaeon]|nr:alkaline phosphatase family protein [Candidatus Nanohaloarchaea archaeon]